MAEKTQDAIIPPTPQRVLHEFRTTVAAPTQVLSDPSGDIISDPGGTSAAGIIHADVRVVSELRVTVEFGPDEDHSSDPPARLNRTRRVQPGRVTEELVLSTLLSQPVPAMVRVSIGSDFAPIEDIRGGRAVGPASPVQVTVEGDQARWGSDTVDVSLTAPGAVVDTTESGVLTLSWPLIIPASGIVTVDWTLDIRDQGSVVVAATTAPLPVQRIVSDVSASLRRAGVAEPRLASWLTQSLADLNGLRMATAARPQDSFFAAGAPWYLTLFGRDSLWTSRLLLPVDVGQAAGTLRTLAWLAGTRSDAVTAESPGKIIHELRRGHFDLGDISLPPRYYGTIDATPLWVCLLHDAWRAGLDPAVVRELLPTLVAALEWIVREGDADGDGFLEYLDASGRGLANQGWKDSTDAVRFADGGQAVGPIALCEVQGYAYQAATSGATLLDAFGLDGSDRYRGWADDLAARFRSSFWCDDGADRYPALALDGHKQRVDAVTSNPGHLLGTGILNADEELLVAQRLQRDDLDSGLGLRTMSSTSAGYEPLSYHCGSVWPHDTAIVIDGLARGGLLMYARGLIEGLLRASVAFDQRLPELWSGEGHAVPYPEACRPQAWSAAAAVTVAAALGQQPSGAGRA